jgi:hypothetical protein
MPKGLTTGNTNRNEKLDAEREQGKKVSISRNPTIPRQEERSKSKGKQEQRAQKENPDMVSNLQGLPETVSNAARQTIQGSRKGRPSKEDSKTKQDETTPMGLRKHDKVSVRKVNAYSMLLLKR